MAEGKMTIEVAYATPDHQYLMTVTVPLKSTVFYAINASGLLSLCPEIDLNKQRVGIFSKFCALSDVLKPGDRVEIYRPLLIDPKSARRKRALKRKSK